MFINNSLKFTSEGFIKISLKLTNDWRMKVEIIDTGIGIQNERKLHILQFISGNANSYDSGIGLYASKLILGYIGSDKIYLQSTINYGTEFSFIVDIKSNQSIRKCTNDFILEDNYNLIQIR